MRIIVSHQGSSGVQLGSQPVTGGHAKGNHGEQSGNLAWEWGLWPLTWDQALHVVFKAEDTWFTNAEGLQRVRPYSSHTV